AGPLHGHHRTGGDEGEQLREERLLDVFGIMPAGKVLVDREDADLVQGEALALEPADYLPDETAPDAVGLHHDECALFGHGRQGYRPAARSQSAPAALRDRRTSPAT